MKPVERISVPEKNMALINFVRPKVFFGDALDYEVCDGTKFIGTLKAGTMVQYVTPPGDHHLMINPTGGSSGKWGYKQLSIETGRVYYVKPNLIPYAGMELGLAESSDNRIETWNTSLQPMAVDKSATASVPQERIDEANTNLSKFKTP